MDSLEDPQSDLIERIKEDKRQFEAKYGPWRKEARDNYDMVAGDGRQWDPEVRSKLEADGKPCVEFNRLGTIVDAVSGSEINNRQETTYIPRVLGSVERQGLSDLRSASARWVRDNCDAEDEESDAFLDVLIAGVGCTLTRMDYEEDPEGQILIERCDPLRLGWDARATKRNNADARSVWEETRFSRAEIEQRWPDKAGDISYTDLPVDEQEDELSRVNVTKYDGDEKAQDGKGLVSVTRYQWFEVEQIYKVLDPSTQQIIELPQERFEMFSALYPQAKFAKTPRRIYMEAFVCGETVLEQGPAPCKSNFSFQFITGKRDRNKGYWYGLVRPGKDPQRWANKFFSQILHIINTNAKGGVMAETGAVSNPKKFEEDWSKSDAVNWLNPGGLGKVQPKQPANIPPTLPQMMDFSISSIRDATGVNLELLGLVDRQQAGVLEAQRTQAGLTILAPFFGSLRQYRKRHGRLLAYFIQEYISDGRLIRVAGEEAEQYVPLLREPVDVDFDVVVDSAPTSRDTKEKTWATIGPVIGMFTQQQIPIPPEILDYLPLPTSLAQKLKANYVEWMKQRQQGDPKQEAMFRAELDNKNADTELKEAGAAQKYMQAQQPGIDAMTALMGPQSPGIGGPPQDPAKQAPQAGMQQLVDAIITSNHQQTQAMLAGLQAMVQAITAPRKAIRGLDGRIEGSAPAMMQ